MKGFLVLALLAGCAAGRSQAADQAVDPPAGCDSPLGFIPDGGSLTGYRDITVPAGHACRSGQLQCIDGVWTGIYIHPDCAVLPR